MKIIYAGTPEFAVPPLKAIINAGYEVVAVLTQQDKPVGRKGIVTPPPVKVVAGEYGIPVLQPEKLRESLDEIASFGAELMVTCAYGKILPRKLLDMFPSGVWNIHASLLPHYRGAAPIQWSVINGDEYTGVTIMKTEEGLDTGDILLVKRTKIKETETAGELSSRLSVLGAEAIGEALKLIEKGDTALLLQDNAKATTVTKITKAQAKIDWNKSAAAIVNLVRGMNPAPVAYTELNGAPINVYRASSMPYDGTEPCGTVLNIPKKAAVKCSDGAVVLEELQLSGGKRIKGCDALNGRKIQKGQVLQ